VRVSIGARLITAGRPRLDPRHVRRSHARPPSRGSRFSSAVQLRRRVSRATPDTRSYFFCMPGSTTPPLPLIIWNFGLSSLPPPPPYFSSPPSRLDPSLSLSLSLSLSRPHPLQWLRPLSRVRSVGSHLPARDSPKINGPCMERSRASVRPRRLLDCMEVRPWRPIRAELPGSE
jgi:hypothetical protein